MAIDYQQLLPEHFLESQISRDYIDAVGYLLNNNILSIDELKTLINPNTVPIEYIQKLADLVNLRIFGVGVYSDSKLRKQLVQAVDWFKIKGTYQSLKDIAYFFDLHAEIKDMYTTDYNTFVPADWFVGNVGENPSGLSNSYYKSPHFRVWFLLDVEKANIVEGVSTTIPAWDDSAFSWDDSTAIWGGAMPTYLWLSSDMTDFREYVETIRPINTVPGYTLKLAPTTNISGASVTAPGGILTAAIGNFTGASAFFNQKDITNVVTNLDEQVIDNNNSNVIIRESQTYYFNDLNSSGNPQLYFNYGSGAVLSSLVKWKLGTGNKGATPSTFGFALSNDVLHGSVDSITTYSDRVVYTINVPLSAVASGISELGLYLLDNTTLMLASTFPDIDKTSDVDMVIEVTLNLTEGA